jgi:hypothetical protein
VEVPTINCTYGDHTRCGTCGAYLSPFVQVNARGKSFNCPLCKHLNPTIHFTTYFDMTVGVTDRPEMHHLAFDIIPPRELQSPNRPPRTFLFLVDLSLIESGAASFRSIRSQFAKIEGIAQPGDQLGIMAFGESVWIADMTSRTVKTLPRIEPVELLDMAPFAPFETSFPLIRRVLKIWHGTDKSQKHFMYAGLKWAISVLAARGGRLILFSSGKATDAEVDLYGDFVANNISLTIFRETAMPALDLSAAMTGGIAASLGQTAALSSLFLKTPAWFGTARLKLSNGFSVTSGNEFLLPVLNNSQSLIFELGAESTENSQVIFQLAVDYVDEEGRGKTRVVNGRIPVARGFSGGIDEAAFALYLARKRAYQNDDTLFREQVAIARRIVGESAVFPHFLFAGTVRDFAFIASCSVERFALTVLPSMVEIGERTFRVLWWVDATIVFPKPEEDDCQAIATIGLSHGALIAVFFFPESEAEFDRVQSERRAAVPWYDTLLEEPQK